MPRTVNPFSYLPRRLQIIVALALFVASSILFLGSSSSDRIDPYIKAVPGGQTVHDVSHHAVEGVAEAANKLPKTLPNVNVPVWLTNPLGPKAHTPPAEQADSTSGETKWYADWKWLNPFSSTVTLDDERAVLPPLKDRPPVYTYWDPSSKGKDEKVQRAERELITVWRRAWWAQGFTPIVLGPAEAMNNPLFRMLGGIKLDPSVEHELMRWLAWGNMNSGILCHFLAVPMAPYNDPLLSFLRRAEYPGLTRYQGLDNGLFVGIQDEINFVVKAALENPKINQTEVMLSAVPRGAIALDSQTPQKSIAFYSSEAIKKNYKSLHEKLANPATYPEGIAELPSLINSHLHLTWQNKFPKGIAVLKPLAEHTTRLIEPAVAIALNLTQCPNTPVAASCPPNNLKCARCEARHNLVITTPKVYRNQSDFFTIATVPHPYTLASLLGNIKELDVRHIRRATKRDAWTLATTKEWLGSDGLASYACLPSLKDVIAGETASSYGLWFSAERPFNMNNEKDLEELDWIFGFRLPRAKTNDGKTQSPVPGPAHSGSQRLPERPKPEYGDRAPPSEAQLREEQTLLELARRAIESGRKTGGVAAMQRTRNAVEAWSLADTEMWKFVRAFNARRRMERRKWEEEEASFRGMWSRWMDGWGHG